MNNYVVDRFQTWRLCRSAGCCFSQDDERDNEVWRVVEASTGPAPRSRKHAKCALFPRSSNQDSRRNLKPIETGFERSISGLTCCIACRRYVRCTIAVYNGEGHAIKRKTFKFSSLATTSMSRGTGLTASGGGMITFSW